MGKHIKFYFPFLSQRKYIRDQIPLLPQVVYLNVYVVDPVQVNLKSNHFSDVLRICRAKRMLWFKHPKSEQSFYNISIPLPKV